MPIADNLKVLRKQKKITQKQLSEQAGIPLRTIINYENGLRQPNAKSLAALERYFEVCADDLLGDLSATKQQKLEMDFLHTLFNDEEDEQDLHRLLNTYMQLAQQGRKELIKRAEEMVQREKCKHNG